MKVRWATIYDLKAQVLFLLNLAWLINCAIKF